MQLVHWYSADGDTIRAILRPTIAGVIGLNKDGPAPRHWSRSEPRLVVPCSGRLMEYCSLRLGAGSRPPLLLSQFVLPLYAILLFFHKETTKGSFIFAENQSTALWLIARGPPPPRSSPEQHECLIFVARQEQVEKWFVGKPKYNWFKWYE